MKSCILQDVTTKHWTLKTEVDGRDKGSRNGDVASIDN